MKWMLSLLALATVVAASPGIQLLPVNPGGIGGLFKGPNSEILIKGPDGSVITALNQGGEVHTGLATAPIVVAEPLAVSAQPVVAVAPNLSAPASAPLVESEQSSDVHGSSGRILTKGSKAIIAGPASTTIADGHGVIETSAVSDANAAAPIIAGTGIQLGATAMPISTIQALGASDASNLAIETVNPQALGVVAPALLAPRVVQSATTTLNTLEASVAIPTFAPEIVSTPTATSLFSPARSGPVINGILPSKIDGKIDLGPPIHLNQLSLGRTLIPSANIIPPEIGVIRTLSPSTAAPSLLASPRAPGLATISSIGSVQRSEIDATPVVSTVSPLGVGHEILIQQDVVLQDPRLQSVNLNDPRLNLNDPRLQNLNLQDPRLQSVNLNDPRLQSVNLQDPSLQNVNLQDPRLQNVNLNDPRLQSVNLQDPSLQNVNLQDPRLQSVNLNDPRLNLNDPRLQNVNLQDPRLQIVNLNDPRLHSVNIQDPSLQNVNLQDPRLQSVNLNDPRLQSVKNVNLQDPRLQNVNLNDPRLQNVNLQDPRLQNVNLHDPRLQQSVQIQPAPVQEPAVEANPISTGIVLDGRLSLANVQQQDQQLLSAELAKAGINAAEVQLTTVPLSAISRVVNPVVNSNSGLGGLPRAEAPSSWNRWGREAKPNA